MSKEALDALEDMVWQFAYRGVKDGRPVLHTGGLSALEHAFGVLDWNDPYFSDHCDAQQCAHPDCLDWGDSGSPTPQGYKRVCGKHFAWARELT